MVRSIITGLRLMEPLSKNAVFIMIPKNAEVRVRTPRMSPMPTRSSPHCTIRLNILAWGAQHAPGTTPTSLGRWGFPRRLWPRRSSKIRSHQSFRRIACECRPISRCSPHICGLPKAARMPTFLLKNSIINNSSLIFGNMP